MWRKMERSDLARVSALSDLVHGRFTERPEIYAERLALCPDGCFVHDRSGRIDGYLISHPWRRFDPPPLDRELGGLPGEAGCWYLHDLALSPEARGSGAGAAAVDLVLAHAREAGFAEISLVAVNGAESFWESRGFQRIETRALSENLASYGPGAFYMARALTGG
ncbi:MAG: GNAT family N-acetyltransferase [Sphingobium sp.]